jgi:tryptophan synthase alpha chain
MKDVLGNILKEKSQKRKLLLPYLTFGYPTIESFLAILENLNPDFIDALEIGIPHSDPVADGPVIQESSQKALALGVTPRLVFEKMQTLKLSFPLIAMTYGNIVYQYGIEKFGRDFKEAGFYGLIVADFPLEAKPLLDKLENLLSIILLASTTTPEERLKKIARESQGFVYLVSGKGVTGKTRIQQEELREVVTIIKSATDLPVLVGFGIDSPEKAKEIASFCDGVIVGSALLHFVAQNEHHKNLPQLVNDFLSNFRKALNEIE